MDAVQYYEDQLNEIEEDISRVMNKEYRIIGTAFVTFTDDLTASDAIKIFK